MNTEKKKRGRPPKIFTAETTGLTYEGVINYALNRQVKSDLDKSLANKDESQLTDDERKYLESCKENKSRTLNIRFTESEYQDIISKCEQYGDFGSYCIYTVYFSVPEHKHKLESSKLVKHKFNRQKAPSLKHQGECSIYLCMP